MFVFVTTSCNPHWIITLVHPMEDGLTPCSHSPSPNPEPIANLSQQKTLARNKPGLPLQLRSGASGHVVSLGKFINCRLLQAFLEGSSSSTPGTLLRIVLVIFGQGLYGHRWEVTFGLKFGFKGFERQGS